MPRVQIKRGLKASLPTSNMLAGEQFFTTDRGTLHVAKDSTTTVPIVPAIDDLVTIGAVSGVADMLVIHDADAVGVKEKKITVDNFKAALNIPAGVTDELVAIVSGGTAGYLYGSGSNGVLRMGPSMTWDKDAGNAFATIDVNVVDCGTF